jgi:hypothetical protein
MPFYSGDKAIPIMAAIVGGTFALTNSAVTETLRRLWARGDRMRLLKSENLRLRSHYAATVDLWKGHQLTRSLGLQAKYPEHGFLSDDLNGLTPLPPLLVARALFLKGMVQNTNAMVDDLVGSMPASVATIPQPTVEAIVSRFETMIRAVDGMLRVSPPTYLPMPIWLGWRRMRGLRAAGNWQRPWETEAGSAQKAQRTNLADPVAAVHASDTPD